MKEKKKFKLPHVYVLLLLIMTIIWIVTFIIPSGEYARIFDELSQRELIDPNSFHKVAKVPVTIIDFFVALHKGFVETADIVGLLLAISGSLAVIEKTGAINAGIYALVDLAKGKDKILLVLLTTLFSLLGAIGFAEGGSVFVPLAVTLALALGYDKMVGAAAGILGLCVGFTSGFANIYTVGVGQAILGLPLFSGIEFRIVCWFILTAVACIYVLAYANKIKKDPSKSIYGQKYLDELSNKEEKVKEKLNIRRVLILIAFFIAMFFQVYGTLKLSWYFPELSAVFLILMFFTGFVYKLDASDVAIEFSRGASAILPASLAISIARSVLIIMSKAQVLDTVIHGLGNMLQGKSPDVTVLLIYFMVVTFNFFITSGSGKAVILMPILGPLGQLTGINQQVMVIIYQMGDGFTNYFWPTSGTVMASLALADVKYEDWFVFSYKFFTIIVILGALVTLASQFVGLGPF